MKNFLFGALVCTVACFFAITACTSDLRQDLNDLKEQVSDLEKSFNELQQACNAGKIIRSIEPLNGGGGNLLTFSDGTTLNLYDAIIADIIIEDRYAVFLLTNGSELRFAIGSTHPTGIVVLSDRVSFGTGTRGKFEFRINPSNAQVDLTINGEDPALQLDRVGEATRAAGSYVTVPENYKLVAIEPSVNEAGEELIGQYTAYLEDCGKMTAYTEKAALVLTVTDENGVRSQFSSSILEISFGQGTDLWALSIDDREATKQGDVFHIKLPYGTDVTRLRPRFETNGAIVRVQGTQEPATLVDFSRPVTLEVVGSESTKTYTAVVHYSDLPIVYISTPSAITSKENWTPECGIEIWNAGEENSRYEEVQIKGRGNSTWGYAKKPYAIKLDKKAEVLGMPKHKRWVLLANYLDVTCMRNAIAFEIARQMDGLAWTPRGRFVDVVMNGKMVGNYYLCEQIKVDANRVDIAEITPEDLDETGITGGYIFELDTYYDELFKFRTPYRNLPVQFKDPDEDIAPEQMAYVQNYFNRIETILYGGNPNNEDVFDYIDMDSFIDWWLVHELAHNGEPGHPKSSYMHKDRGGKLVAGPVWDFDYWTFRSTTSGFIISGALWYAPLLKNSTFISRLKERWALHKGRLEQIATYIDTTAELIQESAEANKLQWPVAGEPNNDGHLSFTEAVQRIKQTYMQRIEEVGSAIARL